MGKFKSRAEYEAWKKNQGIKPIPKKKDVVRVFSYNNITELFPAKYLKGVAVIIIFFISIRVLGRIAPQHTGSIILLWIPLLVVIYLYARKPNQEKLHRVDDIICSNTNCNYKGVPKTIRRANVAAGLFLCLFFLLPGIIYFMIKSGNRYLCPKCGIQLRADV